VQLTLGSYAGSIEWYTDGSEGTFASPTLLATTSGGTFSFEFAESQIVVAKAVDPCGGSPKWSNPVLLDHESEINSFVPPGDLTTGTCGASVSYPLDTCGDYTLVQTAGLPSGSTFPVGTTTNTFEIESNADETLLMWSHWNNTSNRLEANLGSNATSVAPDAQIVSDAGRRVIASNGSNLNLAYDGVAFDLEGVELEFAMKRGVVGVGVAGGLIRGLGCIKVDIALGYLQVDLDVIDPLTSNVETVQSLIGPDLLTTNNAWQEIKIKYDPNVGILSTDIGGTLYERVVPIGRPLNIDSSDDLVIGYNMGAEAYLRIDDLKVRDIDLAQSDSFSFDVTVNDPQPPTLDCGIPVVLVTDSSGAVTVNYALPTASDDCALQNYDAIVGVDFLGRREGNDYFVTDYSATWEQMRDSIDSYGGYLATISDAGENEWLRSRITTPSFIGFNDMVAEGTWEWANGETPGFENWAGSQPDNLPTDADGVAMNNVDGLWDDYENNVISPAVMEVDAPDRLVVYWLSGPRNGDVVTGLGVVSPTYVVIDVTGQTDTCAADVTIVDQIAPWALADFADSTKAVNSNCQFIVPDYTSDLNIIDNNTANGDITITQTPTVGTTMNTAFSVTISAEDNSNNVSNFTWNVSLADNTSPSITCPGVQLENLNASCGFIVPDYTSLATTDDNCSAVTVTQTPAIGSNQTSSFTVTLTADDGTNPTTACNFDVILQDVTAPTYTCPTAQARDYNSDCEYVVEDFTDLITDAFDCSTPLGITQVSPTIGDVMTADFTVTLSVNDLDGNASPCVFDVNLNNAPLATADAGADMNMCANTTFLTTSTATNGTVSWYVNPSIGTFNNNSLEDVTYSPNSPVSGHRVDTLIMTVTGGASCAVARDTLLLSVYQSPNAGSDNSAAVCETSPSFSLNTLIEIGADTDGEFRLAGTSTVFGSTFDPSAMGAGRCQSSASR